MKKFFIFLLMYITVVGKVQASTTDLPYLKFNKSEYKLLYSAQNKETQGFLNEYYKQREGYNNWTELVAIHHYPNVNSFIDNANAVYDYLKGKNCNPHIYINEDNSAAIVDFFVLYDTNSHVLLEYNVFKYAKDEQVGTIAFQYVQRYYFNNGLEADMMRRDLQKSRKKYIRKAQKFKLPKLIAAEIENGNYVVNPVTATKIDVVKQSESGLSDNYTREDYYPCDEFFKFELKDNIKIEDLTDKTEDKVDEGVVPNKVETKDEGFSKSDYYPCDEFFGNLD